MESHSSSPMLRRTRVHRVQQMMPLKIIELGHGELDGRTHLPRSNGSTGTAKKVPGKWQRIHFNQRLHQC
eukprot:10801966-Prorocentrum_lima.AAC.1